MADEGFFVYCAVCDEEAQALVVTEDRPGGELTPLCGHCLEAFRLGQRHPSAGTLPLKGAGVEVRDRAFFLLK